MLLTLTYNGTPATDLGYLLYKNPARAQTFDLTFGKAHVFYTEATNERCTAALLLEVDTVGLVRGRSGPSGEGRALEQYVNDRPYASSSFLSVAIAEVFGTALSGRSRERPELCASEIALEARLSVVPCRGGETVLRSLFEPLGYTVETRQLQLDEKLGWSESSYFTVTLSGTKRLVDLLNHIYVLIPVLDGDKHYWVGDDEVGKLIRHGEGWLAAHPARDLIAKRYLKFNRTLARRAIERLMADDAAPANENIEAGETAHEAPAVERGIGLNEQRYGSVVAALKQAGAKRVLDLGCGGGQLLRVLFADPSFEEIAGVDVSHRALEIAADRLKMERLPERQRERLKLFQGSIAYRDRRIEGFDAAAVVEVIEHFDPPRLAAFERSVFEFARPGTVVVTTPNVEYNVKFETLEPGTLRHKDHRFEWSRAEFQTWANRVASRFGYRVRFVAVGPDDPVAGPPTQMAVFSR